ncbi:hypothetical protein Pst134EA_022456 [Puccinia striiformis f. sp. tritici]|uniref:hypothetical protein n=1 Tax=Puccinia striiformis f. sp. tritici TaxID=168172 RepID=UPI002007F147|nr:hypothetical protein Pst134EA_022456 [Puccinia striiformis f. sp. tritici]KAH9454968.1 hypothetical protein Pst134EA_022456 [Puccinia striiformis f. sp. tritici]
MLRFSRLVVLVLLMASWQVTGDSLNEQDGETPFGCHRNADAICSNPLKGGKKQMLIWAERKYPGKRDSLCHLGTYPQCCAQGKYKDINKGPDYFGATFRTVKLAANEKLAVEIKTLRSSPRKKTRL